MPTSTLPGPPALRRTSFSSWSTPWRVLGNEASWAMTSPWGERAVAACFRFADVDADNGAAAGEHGLCLAETSSW